MTARDPSIEGRRIKVRGLVQGVGFRPHVWRLAGEHGLSGHVLNDGGGVTAEAWGGRGALDDFIRRLRDDAPPLARIDGIEWEPLAGTPPDRPFRIAESAGGAVSTGVVPDAATCPLCLADISDPGNRRFGYAFTNCTHCGPRLSILHSIPYDRARTSMRVFPMCERCRREYHDPGDRRFHAQPNACPDCGPKLWLEDRAGLLDSVDPIAETARRISAGAIAAIKGIGGFHLACDASDEAAVAELRRRKRRYAKPLALMARDLDQVGRYGEASEEEATLLRSAAASIVLLRASGEPLASAIAPGQDRIGFMLPYTPLHHLLMRQLDGPIVLTSGNLSDEPQAVANEEARARLAEIADCWLMHDRDIVNRLDDSVMRIDAPGPAILRRARGLAPEPIALAEAFADAPPVLAMGGELKAAFCLLKDGQAILSQHMGDLEEAATHADYRRNLGLYREIFQFTPEVIAVDAHPDYLSTQWGEALAAETGARLVRVQHHHAHLAACLAEHRVPADDGFSLGIVLDGLGLGPDGTIWGGELLLGGHGGFRRAAHFLPVALPGGAKAAREPWRNLAAHLRAAFGPNYLEHVEGTPLAHLLAGRQLAVIDRMIEQGLNAPLSSSAGRLFDAAAAALGVCPDRQHYEGQAAMEIEAMARAHLEAEAPYPCETGGGDGDTPVLSWRPLWEAILADSLAGVEPGRMAARFHLGLIDALSNAARAIACRNNVRRVALSGGVMQNQILLEGLHRRLVADGFDVLAHRTAPANDGGLALGQAVIAAAALARAED
jgi:hydrogenase maturation protein HypF